MKILLIAYEFPPSPSPQAIRWAYLGAGLAKVGHEVHVLCPDIAGHRSDGAPGLPAGIAIHRTSAGGVMAAVAAHARRKRAPADTATDGAAAGATAPAHGLNWKGRTVELVKRLAGLVTFPDVRGQWKPHAVARMRALLEEVQPDVVISSHEPATTLQAGLAAKRRGYSWVADLGDPVLAPYTPPRWAKKAFRLERAVCVESDHIMVTTEAARALLVERHGMDPSRCTVVTQGFDGAARAAPSRPVRKGPLELCYTGSFYAFRKPDALLEALLATPGVRLTVASPNPPPALSAAASLHPERIRLLGATSHARALQLQGASDILVNIGNDSPYQVPGKLYEYFGAARPILHLRASAREDASGVLLERTRRGLACANDAAAIAAMLADLARRADNGALDDGFDLSVATVAEFDWSALSCKLGRLLEAVVRDSPGAPPAKRAA